MFSCFGIMRHCSRASPTTQKEKGLNLPKTMVCHYDSHNRKESQPLATSIQTVSAWLSSRVQNFAPPSVSSELPLGSSNRATYTHTHETFKHIVQRRTVCTEQEPSSSHGEIYLPKHAYATRGQSLSYSSHPSP